MKNCCNCCKCCCQNQCCNKKDYESIKREVEKEIELFIQHDLYFLIGIINKLTDRIERKNAILALSGQKEIKIDDISKELKCFFENKMEK